MQINEIMSRVPHFLRMDQPVHEAAAMMRDANLGFLPVCDAERHVLGTITDRDITLRIVAAQRSSDTPVRDIMTAEVVTCAATDEVYEAEALLRQHQISRLCCLDEGGSLIGVFGLADLAQRDDAKHAHQVIRDIKSNRDEESSAQH